MNREQLLSKITSKDFRETLIKLRIISHMPVLFFFADQEIFFGNEPIQDYFLLTETEYPLLCDRNLLNQLKKEASYKTSIYHETNSIFYCLRELIDSVFCFIGPICTNQFSTSALHEYMHMHNMHGYYNYSIAPATPREATAYMDLICDIHLGLKLHSADTDTMPENEYNSNNASLRGDTSFEYQQQNYRQKSAQHMPYYFERKLFDCVKKGDLKTWEQYSMQFPVTSYSLGKVSINELQNIEYNTVSLITLLTRAVIAGGVNPYDAYDTADFFLQKLSKKKDIQYYLSLQEKSVIKFCNLSKKAQLKNQSSVHIDKCKYFISRHIRKPFTINDIADYLGLSSNYLGNLFKNEEHMTLKKYIIDEKVNTAKNLLKYSNASISQIADELCFNSQSHFGEVFKKETGVTPTEYRKANKPLNF